MRALKDSLVTIALLGAFLGLPWGLSLVVPLPPHKEAVGKTSVDKKMAKKQQWRAAAIEVRLQIQNGFKADDEVIYVDRKWFEELLTYLIED